MKIQKILGPVTALDFFDRQWILAAILNCSFGELRLKSQEEVPTQEARAFSTAWKKRKQGWPLQYCVSQSSFWGRNFFVNKNVLIPRPETEVLVEQALRIGDELEKKAGRPIRLIDVGTGSGIIAITLKLERPHWEVMASDISAPALQVAKNNAKTLKTRITFHRQSLLDFRELVPAIDLVISNPPYVDFRKDFVAADVKKFEPKNALEPALEFKLPELKERAAWLAERLLRSAQEKKISAVLMELSPRIAYGLQRSWRKKRLVSYTERIPDLAGRKRFLLVGFKNG